MLLLAGIGVLGIACQWLAWWLKQPAILFLLIGGLVIGPGLGLLDPDALFGELLNPIVSLSVAVILFEGSLTLHREEIREIGSVVRNLVTLGAAVTWLGAALLCQQLIGFPWPMALLFGALVVVTGPTVIIPLLRSVRPTARVAGILRWEGITIDPLGAMLAVLVFDYIISESASPIGQALSGFARIVVTGLSVGLGAALAIGCLLRRHLIPDFLINFFVLTMVFAVFVGANLLCHESGLLAVTVMGLVLTNMEGVEVESILDFKESLSVLLISGLFILLAARLEPAQFTRLGMDGLLLLAGLMLVVRPLAVALCTLGSELSLRERLLLGWIAPRGIVAAAISALFALRLDLAGYPDAYLLVPLTFLVIIGTVMIQGLTAGPVARALGVAEPQPRGLLLVAGNRVSLAIGQALVEQGFEVVLADSSWENVSAARMAGMRTYYGNPVSADADRRLDLVGIGRMLAFSPRPAFNALVCLKFRPEFGADGVYAIRTTGEKEKEARHAPTLRGRYLFSEDATLGKLSSLLSQGWEIRATPLSESYDFEAYQQHYQGRVIPLFAIDPKQRLHIFTQEAPPSPGEGWTILGLVPPAEEAE